MSQKSIFIGLTVVIVVGIVGYFGFLKPYLNDQTKTITVSQTITAPEQNISFSYPSGEEGFSLIEPPVDIDLGLVRAFIMLPTKAYIAMQQDTSGTETPPGMSIFVFSTPSPEDVEGVESPGRVSRLQRWANENASLTSITRALNTPEVTSLDGATALHYQADGLYMQDVYLVSFRKFTYLIVGQSDTGYEENISAFENLIETIAFD